MKQQKFIRGLFGLFASVSLINGLLFGYNLDVTGKVPSIAFGQNYNGDSLGGMTWGDTCGTSSPVNGDKSWSYFGTFQVEETKGFHTVWWWYEDPVWAYTAAFDDPFHDSTPTISGVYARSGLYDCSDP
jgi:hypothetical protein